MAANIQSSKFSKKTGTGFMISSKIGLGIVSFQRLEKCFPVRISIFSAIQPMPALNADTSMLSPTLANPVSAILAAKS